MTDSKKTTVLLPPELAERLRKVAQREHRSSHAQILVYIERGLKQDERKAQSAAGE